MPPKRSKEQDEKVEEEKKAPVRSELWLEEEERRARLNEAAIRRRNRYVERTQRLEEDMEEEQQEGSALRKRRGEERDLTPVELDVDLAPGLFYGQMETKTKGTENRTRIIKNVENIVRDVVITRRALISMFSCPREDNIYWFTAERTAIGTHPIMRRAVRGAAVNYVDNEILLPGDDVNKTFYSYMNNNIQIQEYLQSVALIHPGRGRLMGAMTGNNNVNSRIQSYIDASGGLDPTFRWIPVVLVRNNPGIPAVNDHVLNIMNLGNEVDMNPETIINIFIDDLVTNNNFRGTALLEKIDIAIEDTEDRFKRIVTPSGSWEPSTVAKRSIELLNIRTALAEGDDEVRLRFIDKSDITIWADRFGAGVALSRDFVRNINRGPLQSQDLLNELARASFETIRQINEIHEDQNDNSPLMVLMTYSLCRRPFNDAFYSTWKTTESALRGMEDLTADQIMTLPDNDRRIAESLLDLRDESFSIDGFTAPEFAGQAPQRTLRSIIIATLYAVTRHSFAARWLQSGRISPLSILLLIQLGDIALTKIIDAIKTNSGGMSGTLPILGKIFSVFSKCSTELVGTVRAPYEDSTMTENILYIDSRQMRFHRNSVSPVDSMHEFLGKFLSYVGDYMMNRFGMNGMKYWENIGNRLNQTVKQRRINTLNGTLIGVDQPVGAFNSHHDPLNFGHVNFQHRRSSGFWSDIFKGFLSRVTEHVNVDPLPNNLNRKGTMKVLTLGSEISSFSTSIDAIRSAMMEEVENQLSRGSYGVNIDQIRQNLRELRCFIGFQFSIFNPNNTPPQEELDNGARLTTTFRSSGFLLRMRRFIAPGPLANAPFNLRFVPTEIELSRKIFGINEFQVISTFNTMQNDGDIVSANFWESVFHDRVIELVSDRVILEHMRETLTASDPSSEVLEFLNEQVDEEDELDYESEAIRDLYINQVTIITTPVFTGQLFPLTTAKDPRRRVQAPVTGVSAEECMHLLQENKGDIDSVKLDFTMHGVAQNIVANINCCASAAWLFIEVISRFSDYGEEMMEESLAVFKEFLSRGNITNVVLWLECARQLIIEYTENKNGLPIFIFFTSSCRLIEFSGGRSEKETVENLLCKRQFAAEYPVFIINNQFSAQAHIFLSSAGCLYEFLDAKARTDLRQLKEKKNYHEGFVMFKSKMYQSSAEAPKEEIMEKIISNVWTLDIETYSAHGIPMEPYCIVVLSDNGVEFTTIGAPENVREMFRNFLTQLESERSPKSDPLIIYAHNGAKFDWVVLMKDLLTIFPDLRIAGRLTEAKFISLPSINVKLADFFLMIAQSLDSISSDFKTTTRKTKCEEIKDLSSIDDLSEEKEFKILEYCVNDCQCLLECVKKFTERMIVVANAEKHLKQNFILPATSAKLAQNIFSAEYLRVDHKTDIYGNVCLEIDDIEQSAYYGGITQVFTLKEQFNIRYIDVNSLYPAAMFQMVVSLRPAGPDDIHEFNFDTDIPGCESDLLEPGFLYNVKYFEFKEEAFGMLPVRTKEGGLCYPRTNTAEASDWRAGVEIIALIESGMMKRIAITQMLRYPDQTPGLFKEYISDIYKRKAECTDGADKIIYKLLLNALYGKFAERQFEERFILPIEALENDIQVGDKLSVREINSSLLSDIMHEKDKTRKSFLVDLYEKCGKWDQDPELKLPTVSNINKVDNEFKWVEISMTKNYADMQSIGRLERVSLFTTAYARAIMIETMGVIFRRLGGKDMCDHLFYMDTDSFFCSQDAYKIVEQENMISQTELGKFENEIDAPYIIPRARFFASKVYYFFKQNLEKESDISLKCKYKGLKRSLFQNKPAEECIEIFTDIFTDEPQVSTVPQEQWRRYFSMIKISDIVENTVSEPRRLVCGDGSTKSFETVEEMEEEIKNSRVIINSDTEEFEYKYYEVIKEYKKKKKIKENQ